MTGLFFRADGEEKKPLVIVQHGGAQQGMVRCQRRLIQKVQRCMGGQQHHPVCISVFQIQRAAKAGIFAAVKDRCTHIGKTSGVI